MLQYQYVFGGNLSVVVWYWVAALHSTKFSGRLKDGGFFLSWIVIADTF